MRIIPAGDGRSFKGKVQYYRAKDRTMAVRLLQGHEIANEHFLCKSYDISFEINRINFKTQHHALNLFEKYKLFDVLIDNAQYHTVEVAGFNSLNRADTADVGDLNAEQNEAIRSIKTSEVSTPFCIFGPPGE